MNVRKDLQWQPGPNVSQQPSTALLQRLGDTLVGTHMGRGIGHNQEAIDAAGL